MDRIQELQIRIVKARESYFNDIGEKISDEQYDALLDELRELDPTNRVFSDVGAPPEPSCPLNKIKHKIPMGSQQKVNSKEDFLKWVKKVESDDFVIQEKLDGISIEIFYENGDRRWAATRGSGLEGEDISHNVVFMKGVPSTIDFKYPVSIRGEIILRKSVFEKEFKTEGYANPRNTVSGLSRRKEQSPIVRAFEVVVYDAASDFLQFDTEYEKINWLGTGRLGLNTVFNKRVKTENACKWFEHYKDTARAQLDYDIDGLIVKVNNIEQQKKFGETDNCPNGQIAWKFSSEMRESKVISISWEVGRVGRITPVAHIEPVQIGGVTIRKATLYNARNVSDLQIGPGAIVLVSRRGDVIPAIEKVISIGETTQILTKCPVCDAPVEFEGEYLICKGANCRAKTAGNFDKWLSILGIDETGMSFINDIIEAGLANDIADLYTLKAEELIILPGYKIKRAEKILNNINAKKEFSLPVFLSGLNIPNVSLSTFESLYAAGFNTLEKMLEATDIDIACVAGIKEKRTESIIKGLKDNRDIINKLLKVGISITKQTEGKLSGMSFCFTGALSIPRGIASRIVIDLGGTVKTSVVKGLTYLVQADPRSTSNKSQTARKNGTTIINEDIFLDMVDYTFDMIRKLVS